MIKSVIKWKGEVMFMINDSIYNSPVYNNSNYKIISPTIWITEKELTDKFWLKSGSPLSILRKHMFLHPNNR
jgi:hypothetical protein